MLTLRANPKLPGDWKERHNHAVMMERVGAWQTAHTAFESAMIRMLEAWARYADDHRARYGSPIGEDGVLGPEWAAVGAGLRGLLNGDVGPRLDCGTLDGFIVDTLRANGAEEEEL